MRRRAALALILSGLLAVLGPPPTSRAQELVADSSRHLVAITTGFVGTEVLLFGAIEQQGDVIVVVRGPSRREVVRRKGRHAGIWVNDAELTFRDVPSFYSVAASKPIATLLKPNELVRHGIGVQHLRLAPVGKVDDDTLAGFRAGFIRAKTLGGLYTLRPKDVTFLGRRLFRTKLELPANVPTGIYAITVFLVRDGTVSNAQYLSLTVAKIGIGADVYRFAHRSSVLYGIIAIVMALLAGLFAGFVFRKA